MQVLVDSNSVITAYGQNLGDTAIDVGDIDITVFLQPGAKRLQADRSIVVIPPATTASINPTRANVISIAQSSVGIALPALTANQQRALLACLLYEIGAIDANLIIQPLEGWLQ